MRLSSVVEWKAAVVVRLHGDSTYKNYEKLISALERSRQETTEEYTTALQVSQEIHQTLVSSSIVVLSISTPSLAECRTSSSAAE